MNKYFKQYANLRGVAMESENHSKNRAEPKSQTSRENIAKNGKTDRQLK
jgi:hypothetical protein